MRNIRNLVLITLLVLFSLFILYAISEVAKGVLSRPVAQQSVWDKKNTSVQVDVNLLGFARANNTEETFYFAVGKISLLPSAVVNEPLYCLKRMHILSSVGDVIYVLNNGESSPRTTIDLSHTCLNEKPQVIPINKKISISNSFYTMFGDQLFPFDSRFQKISIYFDAESPDGHILTIIPTVIVNSSISDWRYSTYFDPATVSFENIERHGVQIAVILKRPISIILLTVIIFFTLIVFIFGLLKMRDSGSAIQIAVGIFLGLWGVQAILIPPTITTQSLVNIWVVSLYFLLAWAIVTRFIWYPFYVQENKAKTQPITIEKDQIVENLENDNAQLLSSANHKHNTNPGSANQASDFFVGLVSLSAIVVSILFFFIRKQKK